MLRLDQLTEFPIPLRPRVPRYGASKALNEDGMQSPLING